MSTAGAGKFSIGLRKSGRTATEGADRVCFLLIAWFFHGRLSPGDAGRARYIFSSCFETANSSILLFAPGPAGWVLMHSKV